jgi:hypothetical protein
VSKIKKSKTPKADAMAKVLNSSLKEALKLVKAIKKNADKKKKITAPENKKLFNKLREITNNTQK